MFRLPALLAALTLTVLTGCAAPAASPAKPGVSPTDAASGKPGVSIFATTTQLGSIVGDIALCAGVSSTTLLKPGVDPHDVALSASEVARLSQATLIVANGLGLEQSIATTLASVQKDGVPVFEVGPQLDPLPGGEHGAFDPHVQLDAARMSKAAPLIAAEISRVAGVDATACGAKVAAALADTDQQVKEVLARVPAERRVLITDHDAFAYFAKAYSFKIGGLVIPSSSTDAAPSSADIARVVAAIKDAKVPAIFSNTAVNPKLVDAVAAETGMGVKVVPLYVDSLGTPGSDADTYASMMLTNARLIADALT